MESEHEIQTAIIKTFRLLGIVVMRSNISMHHHEQQSLPTGFFDLFGYTDSGQFYEIEVKDEKRLPEVSQVRNHEQLVKDNIIHGLARSVTDAINIVKNKQVGTGFENFEIIKNKAGKECVKHV